jgi:hypothetical protein
MSDKDLYDVTVDSINPICIYNAFAGRNTVIEDIMPLIKGHNLPVSGNMKLRFYGEKFVDCRFDLSLGSGCIRLPDKSTISLNLGKRIDSGTISGVFSLDNIMVNSMSICYGNSGLQLTGIKIPMYLPFKCNNIISMNGTLSLTNIDTREMESILPNHISRSIMPVFKHYSPGFKLESFRIDLRGSIALEGKQCRDELEMKQGVFKIKDAKIPFDGDLVTNVNATGTVLSDGIDIKLSNAVLKDTKINNGVFFISNKDNSWIGNINASIPVKNMLSYIKEISPKLEPLQLVLKKSKVDGIATADMKVVRVIGDKLKNKRLPFRIVEGDGMIKFDKNKSIKLSWNEKKLTGRGDIPSGDNSIHVQIREDFVKNN